MAERVRSFAPIIEDDATVLILGSMPSVMSLARQQYYGHPRNQFWALLAAVYGERVESDYVERLAFLQRHRLALWDTLASCERIGSADDQIRRPQPNAVGTLLTQFPGIQRILLNGQAAARYYRRLIVPTLAGTYESVVLPSSSPLNTAPLADKVAAWTAALPSRVA